jgi:hypothetical protein
MPYRLAADAVVTLHFLFVIFVVAGGFLAWRWRRLAWVHLPAALWGTLIELFHWGCPLTSWENEFRRRAGELGYGGGFIDHYIVPLIYPSGLTTRIQVALGILVIVINAVAYWGYVRRRPAPGTSS